MTYRLGAIVCAICLLAACDGETESDGGVVLSDAGRDRDAGREMDAGREVDAGDGAGDEDDASVTADGGAGDGGGGFRDASTVPEGGFPDAGPPGVSETCGALCSRILECLGFSDPDILAECVGNCSTDLLDCSDAQLRDAYACSEAPDACEPGAGGEAPRIADCILATGCVEDMGGGGMGVGMREP
jgi:hypothetical protein